MLAGCGFAKRDHLWCVIEAFDFEAFFEKGQKESSRTAAEFEGFAGMPLKKLSKKRELGGGAFGIPEDVVELGFK